MSIQINQTAKTKKKKNKLINCFCVLLGIAIGSSIIIPVMYTFLKKDGSNGQPLPGDDIVSSDYNINIKNEWDGMSDNWMNPQGWIYSSGVDMGTGDYQNYSPTDPEMLSYFSNKITCNEFVSILVAGSNYAHQSQQQWSLWIYNVSKRKNEFSFNFYDETNGLYWRTVKSVNDGFIPLCKMVSPIYRTMIFGTNGSEDLIESSTTSDFSANVNYSSMLQLNMRYFNSNWSGITFPNNV